MRILKTQKKNKKQFVEAYLRLAVETLIHIMSLYKCFLIEKNFKN